MQLDKHKADHTGSRLYKLIRPVDEWDTTRHHTGMFSVFFYSALVSIADWEGMYAGFQAGHVISHGYYAFCQVLCGLLMHVW